ncbi:MAG: Hsp20/alpha crystallin family protein [Pseudomonadota bacterium]
MPRQNLPKQQSDVGGPFFPTFQKELNRLIDQFRANFPMHDVDTASLFGASLFPAVDIVETDDTVEISVELPGVSDEDLEASIAADVLTLKGKKSSDHEETEENYHLIERRYGSFRRNIPLGFSPEQGAVKSVFADGVLKLSVKKPAAAQETVQKIDISKS